MRAAGKGLGDKKLLSVVGAVMLLLLVVIAIFAPRQAEDDPTPTTTNNGPQGVKGAYLMLERLGRPVSRWNSPLEDLNGTLTDEQVMRTTLVLAAPQYNSTDQKALAKAVMTFVGRGGRVVTTGETGAVLLGGGMKGPSIFRDELCDTVPEGPGELAQAGPVEMLDNGQWDSPAPKYQVQQRCGEDAVVVSFTAGKGEAVWWANAGPMENRELKNDGDLRLLLASLGDGRSVIFDESLHGELRSAKDVLKGLPLMWLLLQCIAIFALLVFSYSRRRGPIRIPVVLPRSSPVEFAESMGDLYEKGGAAVAAIDAARRRLHRMLVLEVGLSPATISEGPGAIAEALSERLGGDWRGLAEHLEQTRRADAVASSAKDALVLVRALAEDSAAIRRALLPAATKLMAGA